MWKRNADSGIANRRAKELAVEIEKGMNENTRFAAIAHCVPCVHLKSAMEDNIPQRTTDGFVRNADALSLAQHTPSTWSDRQTEPASGIAPPLQHRLEW